MSEVPKLTATVGDSSSRNPGAWAITCLGACGLLLLLAIAAATAFSVLKFRDRELADSERELSNLALVLAEQTDRTFQALELAQTGGPNGELVGVVQGAIDLKYFEKLFQSIALGEHGMISLIRDDGMLLVRHPFVESGIGQSDAGFIDTIRSAGSGTTRQVSQTDGKDRLLSARHLAHYPIVVAVGMEVDTALSGWRNETGALIGAAGSSVLVIGVVLTLLVRIFLRRYRKSELMLREQKLRLDTALNNMSQGLVLFDANARIVVCNKRYLKMYGLSGERVRPGLTLRELIDCREEAGSFPGDTEQYCSKIAAAVAQGKARSELVDTTDGRTIHVINEPMEDGGWVVTHEDVTVNARAAAALRESQARFSDLFEFSPDGLVLCDGAGVIQLTNGEASRMFGYDSSELIGRPIEILIPEDLREKRVGMQVRFSQSAGKRPMRAVRAKVKGLRKDGSHFFAEVSLSPINTGGGLMIWAVVRDITARLRIEEERDRNRAFLNKIVENVPATIFVKDAQRRYVLINRAGEEFYDCPREEMIGKTAYEVFPTATADALTTRDEQLLKSESQQSVDEFTFDSAHNGQRVVLSRRLVIRNSNGEPQYLVGVMQDLTEQKAIEQHLQQAQKMETVGNLTGGMAHDFNNLLLIIIGNLDLLQEEIADRPAAAELADSILQASLRGAELTRQMLAFSRRQPLQPKCINVDELIVRTTQLLTRTLGENIRIEQRTDTETWKVLVDEAQLESALINIAVNARDAMPEGGTLTIATANLHVDADYAALHPGLAPGDYTTIELRDTGAGMPAAVLGHIFEPFYTTKAPGKGTGLGLSMVYGFIKQSGGLVSVDSECGKGTTFKLYLPRAKAAESPAILDRVPRELVSMTSAGEVILAVDDNPDVRASAVKNLLALGYRVLEADSAETALQRLDGEVKVDLLFTDIIMPGGANGTELARTARVRRPDLKVLFTSGFPGTELTDGPQVDVDGRLLAKPYRKQDLAKAVRQALAEP